jgi:uncharacterized membrane protein
MKDLFILGFILIFVGMLLIIISALSSSEGKTKFAFFGFIGPIPFGFGNSQELLKIAIIASIIGLIIFILFLKYLRLL